MATRAEQPVNLLDRGGGEPARLIDAIPPIPGRIRQHGPLTARRLTRFYLMLAAVMMVGIAPVALGMSEQWKAFGLGLVFPGGGFLYAGGITGGLLFLASLAAFAVIMFIWWARGVILGPPAVMVGTALLAAAWIDGDQGIAAMAYAVPAATLGLFGWVMIGNRRKYAAAQVRGNELNAEITKAAPLLRDIPVTAAGEMPDGQIGEYRRMLDLALQPVDSWTGFNFNDSWQDGALRYQISTMSWNLSLGQYTQLPAFHGYLNTAQENLIHKHIHRNTWNYWYWESLWGNFKADKNPVHLDNIMLTGFLGVSLGMFETSSGTSPFRAPGALTFRWDEKTAFPYNHEGLIQELVKNYKRYDHGWYPCEPRWVYSMCNLVGRSALSLYDARHGSDYAGAVSDRFEKTMDEEMMLPDGRIKVCTSSPFGFTVPSLSGLFGETWGIRFLTPHAPEQAERLWQILKRDFIGVNADGSLNFKLLPLGWDTRKPADFSKWPELNPLIMALWAALEMGDDEIITATRNEIEKRYGPGLADSMTWSGANTVRNMVVKGLPDAWKTGPILARADYPDVVVTRAVTDGETLDLIVRAGQQSGIFPLGFARLVPGRKYRVKQTGAELTAAPDGTAELAIAVDTRSEISLVPVV